MNSVKPKNTPQKTTLLLICLNLLITIPLAATLNIWFDEAYSLNTSSQTIEYAFSQAIGFEEQAPIYFILLYLWRQINDSILWARLLSVGCIAATIALMPSLSKRYLNGISPIWLTALVALNPFIVWAGLEIRLYALSILLSALLLLLFHPAYLARKSDIRARLLYILVALISLYTHYFLGLLLTAQGGMLLLQALTTDRTQDATDSSMNSRNPRRWVSYFFDMVTVAILFSPMFLHAMGQMVDLSDNVAIAPEGMPPSESSTLIRSWLQGSQKSLGTFFFYTIPAPTPESWPLVRVGLFGLMIAGVTHWRRSIHPQIWFVWGLTLLLVILFCPVFTVLDHLHFRHASVLVIPALVSLLLVVQLPPGRMRRRSLLLGTSFLLIWNLMCLGICYHPLAKNGDSIRVASYLMAHESQHQPILIFNSEVEMVLTHYYHGINELIALPHKETFQSFNIETLTLQRQDQITDALHHYPQPPPTLWLVTDAGVLKSLPSYAKSYQILETFVETRYQVKQDQVFYGARVRLLEPR